MKNVKARKKDEFRVKKRKFRGKREFRGAFRGSARLGSAHKNPNSAARLEIPRARGKLWALDIMLNLQLL